MESKAMTLEHIRQYSRQFSVLYVEDEKQIRDPMLDVLKFFFKQVDGASDGVEGLALFDKKNYDIVISDILMPRMNGLEMITLIKRRNPKISIIITSAYEEKEYLEEVNFLEIDEYLLKPISKKIIEETSYKVSKKLYEQKQK